MSEKFLHIERAPTSRSKCQSCKEKIMMDEERVGMPARHAGLCVASNSTAPAAAHSHPSSVLTPPRSSDRRSVLKWLHPACFAANLRVDTAPTNRAKCAGDSTPISLGEPRLLMQLVSRCDGKVTAQKIYKPQNALPFLKELREAGGVWHAEAIAGVTELPEEVRAWTVDALLERSLAGRAVPVAPPPKKSRAGKKCKDGAVDEASFDDPAKAQDVAVAAAKRKSPPASASPLTGQVKAKRQKKVTKQPTKQVTMQVTQKTMAQAGPVEVDGTDSDDEDCVYVD